MDKSLGHNENRVYLVGMLNETYGNVNYLLTGRWYTWQEALDLAAKLNKTHLAEAKRLGYTKFVAYNMKAEFPDNYIWSTYLG